MINNHRNTNLEKDIYDILIDIELSKGSLKNKNDITKYVIKTVHLINGGKRTDYCINYKNHKYKNRVVQSPNYKILELRKLLRKKKIKNIMKIIENKKIIKKRILI